MTSQTFSWSFKNTPAFSFSGDVSFPTGLFINNKFAPAVEGGSIDIVNPSTGKKITEVSAATAKDVDAAVDAAQKAAATSWGLNTPGSERGKLMNKLASLIEEHADELSAIETLNSGLTLFFSRWVNVRTAAEVMRYYAGFADKIHGKTIEVNDSKFAYTRAEPIGVVGAIIPWNVPMVMACLKLAPALATGNCVILKPSELTPLTALRLAELVVEAGFPPGVVNIIPGFGNQAGAAMASHFGIGKIAFTGSTNIGRQIMKAAAESNIKKVTLELGGKSPTVVLADADIVQAAKWSALGIMVNMGQTCSAGSRVYVHADIYTEFMKEFMTTIKGLSVGDPFGATTFNGPQVSKTQFERILSFIAAGKKEGATLETGGKQSGTEGYFIEPTVFTDVTSDMTIVKEEIFGPVVVVAKFSTEEELLELANKSFYGLAAAVFSRDISKALTTAHKLEAGTIWVNQHSMIEYMVPFGGFKQSGIGREYGEDALQEYLEIKAVHVNLTAPAPI